MIAATAILRNWRACLLGILSLGFALSIFLTLANERSPSDQLPLRGVPDSAYASAGVILYPAYGEKAAFGPKGAEFIAGLLVCCGTPTQTVLVTLGEANGPAAILSYALNYDTDKAPESAPLGGKWVTSFAKEMDYFVVFLDAKSGDMIFRLWPDHQDPFPSTDRVVSSTSGSVVARNLDGPDVLVTLLGFLPKTTVVECGEEEALTTQDTDVPSYVSVNDASSGKLLFERYLQAGSRDLVLSIRHDGIVIGEEAVSSSGSPPRLPCR